MSQLVSGTEGNKLGPSDFLACLVIHPDSSSLPSRGALQLRVTHSTHVADTRSKSHVSQRAVHAEQTMKDRWGSRVAPWEVGKG